MTKLRSTHLLMAATAAVALVGGVAFLLAIKPDRSPGPAIAQAPTKIEVAPAPGRERPARSALFGLRSAIEPSGTPRAPRRPLRLRPSRVLPSFRRRAPSARPTGSTPLFPSRRRRSPRRRRARRNGRPTSLSSQRRMPTPQRPSHHPLQPDRIQPTSRRRAARPLSKPPCPRHVRATQRERGRKSPAFRSRRYGRPRRTPSSNRPRSLGWAILFSFVFSSKKASWNSG